MKTLSDHYREKFGCKVYKLSLDGGFSCPNRDGTLGTGGCIFCTGSGEFAEGGPESVAVQLGRARQRVAAKNKGGKYIAYFQAFTNTYAPVERLRQLYRAAIEPEEIVGLSIGTRPDCLEEDVIDLLREINAEKPVSVELGLQTIHAESARYIRRGYSAEVYYDAVRRLKEAGIEVDALGRAGVPRSPAGSGSQTDTDPEEEADHQARKQRALCQRVPDRAHEAWLRRWQERIGWDLREDHGEGGPGLSENA